MLNKKITGPGEGMGGGLLCFLGEAGTSCAGVQAHWTVPFSSWFLQSWMTKVLPMLDDSEPVHSDIFVTDDLELPSLKTEEGILAIWPLLRYIYYH